MNHADNLFASPPPAAASEELFSTLLEAGPVRVERIVSLGHVSPPGFWYDQPTHEWVAVLRGAARLAFEEGAIDLRPGDFVHIRAGRKHRVEWTTPDEPTVWLAVHYHDAPPKDSTGGEVAARK